MGSGDHLTIDDLQAALVARGYAPSARFHGAQPFVAIVEREGNHDVGRFFPSRNAILVVSDEAPDVVKARLNHEFAHAINYEHRCGGTRRDDVRARSVCGYHGEHDRGFYRTLEQLHRESGVSPELAVIVEGRYEYPAAWRRASW